MAHKFAELAFTPTVRDMQTEMGSRAGYAGMDTGADFNHMMSAVEAEFISLRDSFYMATVSETGWPYVQHRGGPAGFVKVLDAKTIGFSDYAGNRQYVSAGNLKTDNRVSLFFMDYPNRRRLKILGRVTTVDPGDLETLAKLEDDTFRAPIERAFLIHIEAFDWNCPKYITPRYTDADLESVIAPLQDEIARLRANRAGSGFGSGKSATEPLGLGNGPLPLVITAIRQEADGIRSYELQTTSGKPLPPVKAGAHLQVPVSMQDGSIQWRFYSISSAPNQRDTYRIAVLDQPDGRGGSHTLHHTYQVGQQINCQLPGNYFALQGDKHKAGGRAIFIAGGVGITPMLAMVKEAEAEGYGYHLHYAARSSQSAAFLDEIKAEAYQSTCYFSSKEERLDLDALIAETGPDDTLYVCGPVSMIAAAREAAARAGLAPNQLVFETFDDA